MKNQSKESKIQALLTGDRHQLKEAAQTIKASNPSQYMAFPHLCDGLYSYDGKQGLTESEMREATKGRTISIITVRSCAIPLASSEKEVIERDRIETHGY